MRHYLQAAIEPPYTDWEHLLAPLRLAYNTSISKATKASPFSLVFGMRPHMPFFDFEAALSYDEKYPEILANLKMVRKKARENNLLYKEAYAKAYNK